MNTLSIQRPLPSRDANAASVSTSVKSTLVNWLPWSLLKIPAIALERLGKASTQKLASSVLDRRQDSTLRLAQSITATRYRKPHCRGM